MSNDSHIISLRTPKEPPRIPPPILPEKDGLPWWIFAILALMLLLVGWGLFHFYASQASQGVVATSTPSTADDATKASVQKEANDLVAEVGSLILLPFGETPTIATVSDPEKLKGQQFFKNAVIGDKVLIYTVAKTAYLYRPSTHLLIEVAPITTDAQQ